MILKMGKYDVKATCGSQFILKGMKGVYEYVNGGRVGEAHSYKYTVLLPERMYEELDVTIPGPAQMEAPEELVPVTFVGLELMTTYSKAKGDYIAGSATGIAPVKRG